MNSGYTYKANKDSRRRHDLGRIAKSALLTLGVLAAMIGYQSTAGSDSAATSASSSTHLVQ